MPIDTRISLKKLELFCLVAELGSLKGAAEALFVTQPVVTAHIRSLNERLGVQLLYRERNRMLLTEAGEAVYRWATRTLRETRDLDAELTALTGGTVETIRVSAGASIGCYVIPELISAFRVEHPQVLVTVSIADEEGAARDVETGASDFGIMIATESVNLGSAITVETIAYEDLVLAASSNAVHPACLDSVSDLTDFEFIASPRDHFRQQIVERELRERGVHALNVVAELGHAEAMKRMIQAGDAVGFLFRSSVQAELEHGEMRELIVSGLRMSAPIVLIHRVGRGLSQDSAELMDSLRLGILRSSVPA